MDTKEVKIPAMLLAAALAIFGGYAFLIAGVEGTGIVLGAVTVSTIIGVLIAIVACFIVAAIMDISFGPISHASLKLAAIFTFPGAVGLAVDAFIPLGIVVRLVLYLSLLIWLFELDGLELIVTVVVIWLASWVSGMVFAVMLLAAA